MQRRVQQYIRDHALLPKGGKVLVCVSGGADSVALLDILLQLHYDCVVAHCNFHLRGEESNRDEHFVRHLCDQLQVPLFVEHFDTISYAQEKGLSIEMAARELRYNWFAHIAEEQECCAIAVAHHQNDQAETLLLNLKRGTGLRGLCGMRPKTANPCCNEGPVIIRPLLCLQREYIEYYLQSRGQDWVNDSTNTDVSITRNAIRQQLSSYTSKEIENMAQTAAFMQGYTDIIDNKNTREAEIVTLYENLRSYHFTEIDKIYDALQRGEGGKTFTSATHVATIRKGKLEITPKEEISTEE